MSVARSCFQCRSAKVKCDRGRPSCGRCLRRNTLCTGFPVDDVFRDENAAARLNSQRARGEGVFSRALEQRTPSRSPFEDLSFDLRLQYPWLNERALMTLPEPLKRSSESRAIDRFFVNWILHPGTEFPGHMSDLPVLYHNAPESSVLWHAVRAVAFADLGDARDNGVSFNVKARRSYGEALLRIREETAVDAQELATNRNLAALLLIDSFESIYLAQSEPLGPHSAAIRYVLDTRRDEQLYDRSGFSLWCLATHRLLSRQILLRERPFPVQLELRDKLNTERADIHISADVADMTNLCAAVKDLVNNSSEDIDMFPGESIDSATALIKTIQDFLHDIDTWTSAVKGVWRPKTVKVSCIVDAAGRDFPPDHPLAQLDPNGVWLHYQNIWLAFIWNFHAACQIVLRESLVDLVRYRARVQDREPNLEDSITINDERIAIERLTASIIRSFPPLMGFTDGSGERLAESEQGKMAGRFLALFEMNVIRRAEFTTQQHKHTAGVVINWIHLQHALT